MTSAPFRLTVPIAVVRESTPMATLGGRVPDERARRHLGKRARSVRARTPPVPPAILDRSTGRRAPHIIAVLVGLAGVVTLLSSAISPLHGQVQLFTGVVPLSFRAGATSVAALAGLGLLVVAGGLYRRQRRAWSIGLVLLVLAGVSHLIKDLDAPSSALTLALAVVLLWTRQEFYARPGPGSARRAFLALPMLALASWAFGWLATLSGRREFAPNPSIGRAALAALRGLVGLSMGITPT